MWRRSSTCNFSNVELLSEWVLIEVIEIDTMLTSWVRLGTVDRGDERR